MKRSAEITPIARMAVMIAELRSPPTRDDLDRSETIMRLGAAAEEHDRTTSHHLQNVRDLAEAVALELEYDGDEAHNLGLAAVLHDIGKICLPISLLTWTGRFSNAEWEAMKLHTVWGERLLAGIPSLATAAMIARSHHERWEGNGYPEALSGEQIPEAAAIVAVADAFDAIIHGRPYRPARTVEQALIEIVAGSGRQFSPEVVAALLRLRDQAALPVGQHWARFQ